MKRSNRSSTIVAKSTRVQVGAITAAKAREPFLKRPLDVILSTLMLILSMPVFLLMALAIKLEDGGPPACDLRDAHATCLGHISCGGDQYYPFTNGLYGTRPRKFYYVRLPARRGGVGGRHTSNKGVFGAGGL